MKIYCIFFQKLDKSDKKKKPFIRVFHILLLYPVYEDAAVYCFEQIQEAEPPKITVVEPLTSINHPRKTSVMLGTAVEVKTNS